MRTIPMLLILISCALPPVRAADDPVDTVPVDPSKADSAQIDLWVRQIILAKESLHRQLGMHVYRPTPATRAADALGRTGPAGVKAIVAAMDHRDELVRQNLVFVLCNLQSPDKIAALVAAGKDPASSVREMAVLGLHPITDRTIREHLMIMLKDPDARVKTAVLQRLVFIKPIPTASQISNVERNRLIESVSSQAGHADDNVRLTVAATLGSYHDSNAAPALIKLLADDNTAVRGRAALSLGESTARIATPALLAATRDTAESVRGYAAMALGQLEDARATPRLLEMLTDPSSSARIMAARALGLTGDRKAVLPLIKLLDQNDETLQIAAVDSLGQIRDTRAVEPLIKLMNGPDRVLPSVITALGNTNDARAAGPLADFLFTTKVHHAGQACVKALLAIRDESVIPLLAQRATRPGADNFAALEARRIVGRLTGRGFDFDADGFARWWREYQLIAK